VEFSFDSAFGTFDKAQLQRGFKVYQEVCSACHSLKQVAFRDLAALGYNEAEVKAIAKNWASKAQTFDPKTGDRGERPNMPADHFPAVYYAGQGVPPDLSLITKSRHGGAQYVHSLLTGYAEQVGYRTRRARNCFKMFPDAKTPDGLYFNPYFANLNLADAGAARQRRSGCSTPMGRRQPSSRCQRTSRRSSLGPLSPSSTNASRRVGRCWASSSSATALAYLAKRNVWADKH